MWAVYVIKSKIKAWYYIGMTSNLSKRIKEHNLGKVKSTQNHKPFKFIFSRTFEKRLEARDYEKFLKIRSNKEKLLNKLGLL